MSRVLPSNLSLRSPILYIAMILAISLGVSSYAWYDHLVAHGETVAGNVEYAGNRLDGDTAEEVRATVEARADLLLSKEVVIETSEGPITMTARRVGFTYDIDRAVTRILDTRHRGNALDVFTEWVSTVTTTARVDEPIGFDPETATEVLGARADLVFEEPREPVMEMNDEFRLAVVPGEPGTIADIPDLAAQLGDLDITGSELTVTVSTTELPPQFSDAAFDAKADELNELTQSGERLIIGGEVRQMAPAALRRHLTLRADDGELIPEFDLAGFQAEIESVFPDTVGGAEKPTFEVDGETATLVTPGSPADICCSPGTAGKLADAILSGAKGPFALTTRPDDDAAHAAWYDGSLIVEQVSSFTTPHNCCESRVTNIHQIADIVRGYYMVPGEVLSLNEFVGPRTREKGFVPAGAIRAGHHTAEVGGGVSQFATTIFNAAYFAGLDIVEYRAHSEYFSRYPYGREATISTPAPDLVIKNTTEYPVLIWTSYTGTSVTVSMYSTKNIEVEQIALRSSKRNQCTYVETDRERVYSDGERVVDTFFALYRPAAGIDCNGNRIPELD